MTDNKNICTPFGDRITTDVTNKSNTLRRVNICPRDVPGYVQIEFDLTTGEYVLTLEISSMNRHFARNMSNSLGGIITWADNESWPARDDYKMRIVRQRMELDELQAQEAEA